MKERFTVHSGQTSPRAKVTYWVRDSLDPKWPDGPYETKADAEKARTTVDTSAVGTEAKPK
jgi:hypothetical protein